MNSSAKNSLCARLMIACAVVNLLASCSANVSAPPEPPAPIAVTPSAATLYSELPTTFVLSGGAAPYFVTSSDQATVPVIGSVTGTSFTVIPGPVATDTPVTVTVSDSVGTTPATASLTVRPRIVSNVVTITPSSSACGNAVCPGGDAEVRVVLMQNGVPLSGRLVRFEVTSGQALVLSGSPEVAASSGTTLTDATGTARIRIRVPSGATEQTALIQITDVTGGSRVLTSLAVAIASAPLNAQPAAINFTGRTASTCATNEISATVLVFGGRPPYSVSQPANFVIEGNRVVTASGGSFTVRATGVCVPSETIAIVDGNGSTVSVTVANVVGTAPAPTAISASPDEVTLDSCQSKATVILAGGLPGNYQSSTDSGAVLVQKISQNQFTIQRKPDSLDAQTPLQVGFTDGQSVTQVTVNLGLVAQGPCPAGAP